jgi:hypothetical protein
VALVVAGIAVNNAIAALEDQVAALQAQVATLQAQVAALMGWSSTGNAPANTSLPAGCGSIT